MAGLKRATCKNIELGIKRREMFKSNAISYVLHVLIAISKPP